MELDYKNMPFEYQIHDIVLVDGIPFDITAEGNEEIEILISQGFGKLKTLAIHLANEYQPPVFYFPRSCGFIIVEGRFKIFHTDFSNIPKRRRIMFRVSSNCVKPHHNEQLMSIAKQLF